MLSEETLYFTDNGAIYHGRCCGTSAQFTGRDISGQRVEAVSQADIDACAADGVALACEACDNPPQRKRR